MCACVWGIDKLKEIVCYTTLYIEYIHAEKGTKMESFETTNNTKRWRDALTKELAITDVICSIKENTVYNVEDRKYEASNKVPRRG